MNGPLEPLLETYAAAAHAGDVDAFMSIYDDGVQIFDLWSRQRYDGADAWRGSVQEWFSSLGGGRVRVTFAEVQPTVSGDLAFLHARVTYAAESAAGETLRAMQNRLTWVLCHHEEGRQGGGWRVVHEHTSAPVDPQTGKAVLQP